MPFSLESISKQHILFTLLSIPLIISDYSVVSDREKLIISNRQGFSQWNFLDLFRIYCDLDA
jgi:hypothetical protein